MTCLFQVALRPLLLSALPFSSCLMGRVALLEQDERKAEKHTHSLLLRRVPERSIIWLHLLILLLFTWPHDSARVAGNAILWLDVQAFLNKIRSQGGERMNAGVRSQQTVPNCYTLNTKSSHFPLCCRCADACSFTHSDTTAFLSG